MGTNQRHGNRAVSTAETLSDKQRADLAGARPTDEEIAADRWADEHDTRARKVPPRETPSAISRLRPPRPEQYEALPSIPIAASSGPRRTGLPVTDC